MILRLDNFTPAFPISAVVIVGVCAAGKSTLASNLARAGIEAKPVAQEHSGVPELFRRTGETVIVLVANWESVHKRRRLAWEPKFYQDEWDRLTMARQKARLIVHTDWLTAQEVANRVVYWFDEYYGFAQLWLSRPEINRSERVGIRAHFNDSKDITRFDSHFGRGI